MGRRDRPTKAASGKNGKPAKLPADRRTVNHPMARALNRHNLRPLQLMFIMYFMQGHKPTQAVLKTPGLTDNYASAAVLANRYMDNSAVINEIKDQMQERAARLGLTGDRLVLEFMNIAFSNPQDLYDKHNNLRPIKDLPPHIAKLILSIEQEELYQGQGKAREWVGTLRKVKLHSRTDALNQLCKLMGLTPDTLKVIVQGPDGGPVQHAHVHADLPPEEVARLYMEQVRGGKEVIDV